MSTVREFLQEQLEGMGVLAAGETMAASDATRALSILTNLIKSWNIQGLLVNAVTRETLTLTSGQSSRTIGATGNLVTTRPNRILNAAIKISNVEYPIELITAEQWAEIPDKSSSGMPTKLYIEGTYPNETLNFWPTPDSNYSLVLQSLKPIVGSLALSDSISMPDGYEWSLGLNFRVSASPFWAKQVDQNIALEAHNTKEDLKRQNQKASYMKSDAPFSTGVFDINSGDFN